MVYPGVDGWEVGAFGYCFLWLDLSGDWRVLLLSLLLIKILLKRCVESFL